jgi:uncharacterized protein
MKKLAQSLTLAVSSVALAFGSAGAASETPAAATTTAAATAGPALWKVADEDTTIYLFGTVHVLPEGIAWYGPRIEQALTASDTLVTEIPSGPETDAKMQQLVMTSGMLPADQSLREMLDADQRAKYEGGLAKIGLPANAFDRFEPWMAGLTLTVLPLVQQGYSPDAGVEKQLEAKAGAGKARGALETVEYQIGIFDSMAAEAQIEFLVAAAEAVEETKPMLDKMVAEWLKGDADALAAIMNEELGDPAVAEALLYSRNANWAEWIDARMAQPGTVFVAVGAGHLAGERSVQDLLAQRGIDSERVQ